MNRSDQGPKKKIQEYSYLLSNCIGKGYSSQVYRGRNDHTNDDVAIKVIDVRMIKSEVHRSLLTNQLQALKALKNTDHIISLYDVYNTKNNTYIITELCQGGDLGKMLQEKKKVSEIEAIENIKQIIQGYSVIHRNGIIHRDLKPANIFISDGFLKIADFGFAMKCTQGKKYCNYNVGSPIYMSPQALNENKYSYKSDIWALGVIFYEMLTGKTPWKAKTQKELGNSIKTISIKKLLPSNISQRSIDFLTKTLQIDFSKRMSPEQLTRFQFDDFLSTNRDEPNLKVYTTQSSLSKNLTSPKITNQKKSPLLNFTDKEDTKKTLPTSTTINQSDKNIKASSSNYKAISKNLLSQIHFCRFIYKLLIRINQKLKKGLENTVKNSLVELIFTKLNEVKSLTALDVDQIKTYEKSSDYEKIKSIVHQYREKYQNDFKVNTHKLQSNPDLEKIQTQLSVQIVKMHSNIQNAFDASEVKEEIIVLDYLITLRQLIGILNTTDLEGFHQKSKIQTIVEGAPAKNITREHIRAISAKLKAIKLI